MGTNMIRLLLALLLVSSAPAQIIEAEPAAEEKPSIAIDLKTGKIIEKLSAERVWLTTADVGTLVVDPPTGDLSTMEPILVEGMFQGWREKARGPALVVLGQPTAGNRWAPIVIGNGDPGQFAKVSLTTTNLVASSTEFADFPRIQFDVNGRISFRVRVTDSQPWIVHVRYRSHIVEIRGQWLVLEDF